MKHKLYSAAMTPFTDDNQIDIKSMEKMINRNLNHGVTGFFFLGTMGEGLILKQQQKLEIVEAACDIVGNKAKNLINISDMSIDRIFDNINTFSKYDFSHYVLQLPVKSLLTVNDPVDFILQVAAKVDRPMYLYHIPGLNNCDLSMEQFKQVLSHPKVSGLKNSSGNMYLRRELLLLKEDVDFELFEGQEWSIDEACMLGCDGVLCGMTSLGSKLMAAICNAAEKNDFEQAKTLQNKLIRVFHAVFGKDLSTIWVGQKYALQKLGIFSTYNTTVQKQMEALTNQRKQEIDTCLEEYAELLD